MKILEHAKWSGANGLFSLATLIATLVGMFIALHPSAPSVPQKRLVVVHTGVTSVDATMTDAGLALSKPTKTYLIEYSLINSGEEAIIPADFAEMPRLSEPQKGHIIAVKGKNPYTLEEHEVESEWSYDKTNGWHFKPLLLNAKQCMPFTVAYAVDASQAVTVDYDPVSCIYFYLKFLGDTKVEFKTMFPPPIRALSSYDENGVKVGGLPPVALNTARFWWWSVLVITIFLIVGGKVVYLYKHSDQPIYVVMPFLLLLFAYSLYFSTSLLVMMVYDLDQVPPFCFMIVALCSVFTYLVLTKSAKT